MKLLLKDLIPDKFYYCYTLADNKMKFEYVFKFKSYDDQKIYTEGFHLVNNLYYIGQKDFFCTIHWFNNITVESKEIDISLIIDYLPDDNFDKKLYLRNIKINTLLNG